MKILLRESVHKLGSRGDVVSVSLGYARNYLIPRGLAFEASKANVVRLEREHRVYTQKMAELKESAIEVIKKIKKTKLTLEAKASDEGHLYGSISDKDIAAAYAAEGVVLDPKSILLEGHVKEVGVFTHRVHLHPDLADIECQFWVVAEG